MHDSIANRSLLTISFPRQTRFIKNLRFISFIINDFIILVSVIALYVWIANVLSIKLFLYQKLAASPFAFVLFFISSTILLFGAKRHVIDIAHDAEKEERPGWTIFVPIFLALITGCLGFINLINLTNSRVLSLFHTSTFGGFCFFLIGISLIPPFTRIPHRFHITQLLNFIVGGFSAFIIFENAYQLFSPLPIQHIVFVSLPTALSFTIFSFGVLIRWSNRGFIGNFTLDSAVSMFAFRLFIINILAAPLLVFSVLFLMHKTTYNMYQVLAVVVACLTCISCTILWINMKFLYKYELEHLLMKEALHVHNIDLSTEEEVLRKRIAQLEQEKQQYENKLASQTAWQNAIDTLG